MEFGSMYMPYKLQRSSLCQCVGTLGRHSKCGRSCVVDLDRDLVAKAYAATFPVQLHRVPELLLEGHRGLTKDNVTVDNMPLVIRDTTR